MDESILNSVKVAAGCINGDLKENVFRQFLKVIDGGIRGALNSEDVISGFSPSAVFLATTYQKSTEDERKTLSKQISEELLAIKELVEELCLFWKRGKFY